MNDFTKEELERIEKAFYWYMMDLGSDTGFKYLSLIKKIQLMLESYCEHDPHGDFHICVEKCRKCGVICE